MMAYGMAVAANATIAKDGNASCRHERFPCLQQLIMVINSETASRRKGSSARRMALALVALGILLLAVPFFLAGLSVRNGYYSCADETPESMPSSSDFPVQIKHRVTLFPLVLECSYRAVPEPTSADYTVVSHDLGTAWWLGAPASFLAAAAVWIASRNPRPLATPA